VRLWHLTYGRDGTSVRLEETPFWAWAAQELGEQACWLTEKTIGFCFIAPPDWMYRLRWAPLDDDGFTDKSLGSKIHTFGQALCSGFGAFRMEKLVATMPVTEEWVLTHLPDAAEDHDEGDSE
jgi:hypothetical protein